MKAPPFDGGAFCLALTKAVNKNSLGKTPQHMNKTLVRLLLLTGLALLVYRVYVVLDASPRASEQYNRLSSNAPRWSQEEPEHVKLQPDTYKKLYKFVLANGKSENRGLAVTYTFPRGRSSISLFSDKEPAILLVFSHLPGDTLEVPTLFYHINENDEAELALPDARENIGAIRSIVDSLLTEI